MKRLLGCIAAAIFFSMPISLQAGVACDAAKLKEGIQAELDTLEANPAGALRAIISLAISGIFDCEAEGHSFSDVAGAQPVLGPLAVSEGLHIITLTTEGRARVDGVALEGCGNELDGVILGFDAGQAIRGAANLVRVEGDCAFYLELSRITAPWTLTIKRAP